MSGISDLTAAQLSLAAYGKPPPAGWTVFNTYSTANNSVTVLYNAATLQVVMAFKGSTNISNFYSDLTDSGYAEWEEIASTAKQALVEIKAALAPLGNSSSWQIMTDGHSLGGGLAQTFALLNGLSGYGQNSLPISQGAINDIVDLGGPLAGQVAAWQTAGNYFKATNVSGDIATLYYKIWRQEFYLSTSTTTLASPYAAGELAMSSLASAPSSLVYTIAATAAVVCAGIEHSINTVISCISNPGITGDTSSVDSGLVANAAAIGSMFSQTPMSVASNGDLAFTAPDGSVISVAQQTATATSDTYSIVDNGTSYGMYVATGGSGQTFNSNTLGVPIIADVSAGSNTINLTNTGEVLTASKDAVTVSNNLSETIVGSSDTITANNDTLSVTGLSDIINGSGNTVTLGAATTVTFNGGSNTITALLGGKVTATGNGNILTLGSGSTASFTGTGESITASSDTITLANNTVATISGNSNKVTGGSGDTIGVVGNSDVLTVGSSASVTVTGSGATINESSGTVVLGASTSATVKGNGDNISGSGSDALTINGTQNTVTLSNSSITAAAKTSFTATGNGDTLFLSGAGDTATVSGTTINASGNGDTLTLVGTGNAIGISTGTITVTSNTTSIVQGNSDTVLLQGSNDTLTIAPGATGDIVNITAGATNEVITASGITVNAGTGSTLRLIGSNVRINVGNPTNLGAVTSWNGNNIKVVETNPDNTRQEITVNSTGSVWKDSISYLANGQKVSDVKSLSSTDESGSFQTFSLNSIWKWSSSTVIFGADGSAVRQVTPNADGTEFVTLFNQTVYLTPFTTAIGTATYLFSTIASANNAIASNNWSGASGSIAMVNGDTSTIYVGLFGQNLLSNSNWVGSASDSLSGVSSVQFYGGLLGKFDVNTLTANAILGNNATSSSEGRTLVGNLANTAVDPLVINVKGGAVTTTAVGQNGVYFDMLGDGESRATGWITAGEGFLVDLAHGGANVTSGSQFITDMEQLATYDSNGNGVLTGAESATLRVWVPDASGSGNGRAGQLYTLSQLGIASIDLSWTAAGTVDNDNYIDRSFNFTFADGTTGKGAEVALEVGGVNASSTTGATLTQTGLNQLVCAMGSFAVSPVADTSFTRVMSATAPSIGLTVPH
jgi:hypothetical protein